MSRPVKIDGWRGFDDASNDFVTMHNSSGVAIVAGDFVMLDTGGGTTAPIYRSIQAADVTGNNEGLICGIAAEAIAIAAYGRVQVRGLYEAANVATTVAAGDRLVASSSAGRAVEATTLAAASASFDYTVVAVVMDATDAASNQADVWLLDPLRLSGK